MDSAWAGLVILSALYGLWPLPIEMTLALASSLTSLIAGCALILIGMIESRSLRKVSGMEVSKLITTGIYRWIRNPQFLGFGSECYF